MRYKAGGPFADAVAAVRAGRRPPRPNATPTIGRAAPTAVPAATQARPVVDRGPAPAPPRTRTTGSHHRSAPPARRTFSSGQRALLWAAGVLGALAIVIAILIVLNAQDRKDQPQPGSQTSQTSQTAPAESPAAAPARFDHHGSPGDRVPRPTEDAGPPTVLVYASEQMLR